MAVEIKNELLAAAIVDGGDGGAALQLFGIQSFARTGVGVYTFTMADDIDPTQYGIFCKAGINDVAQPGGRFTGAKTLEVRSYLADNTPADNAVLFVEVHRYPGVLGATYPAAPPIPTPSGGDGSGLAWHSAIISNESFIGVAGILYPWDESTGPSDMTFPVGPADNDLIGIKNIGTGEVNSMGFESAANDMEDPDTGGNAVAGFYVAGSGDGGFGGSLALVIWRFSVLTTKWHIMHAAKRGSTEVLAPP